MKYSPDSLKTENYLLVLHVQSDTVFLSSFQSLIFQPRIFTYCSTNCLKVVYSCCHTDDGGQAFSTRVQGGGGAEVALHPAPLQRIQGAVGLAHPAGYLLRGRHRTLQR